jgi:la-related protein 1
LLVASRLELQCGRYHLIRGLLNRAWVEVPDKSKSVVFLECSRVEEFLGDSDLARQILQRAKTEVRSDWKVFMESVLLELRQGDLRQAVVLVIEALAVHPGAGRLWSLLIHLCHRCECLYADVRLLTALHIPSKQAVVLQALSRCPKSGKLLLSD